MTLNDIPNLQTFGDIGHDGHIFVARRAIPKLVFTREIDPFLPLLARAMVATDHPGPALLDEYHGRQSERLKGVLTVYVRSKDTLEAIERSPWFRSAMGQFRLKFRVMYADALVPNPWCEEWETWFFPPGTQLHWLLMSAWLYYQMDKSVLCDAAYDTLARMFFLNYDWLERKGHQHLKYAPKEALAESTSLYREVLNFPMMVQQASEKLYDLYTSGNIRGSFHK